MINLNRPLLAVDPALIETEAEKLLLEWYEQWEDRNDMPVKMNNGLHVRTMMYWVEKRQQTVTLDELPGDLGTMSE